MWDSVKGLKEVKTEDICNSSLVHWCSHSLLEATRLIRQDLPLVKPRWLS